MALVDRLAADLRASSGTQPPGELATDLHRHLCTRPLQGLRIGVQRDELDALKLFVDHAVDGVATGATDADDLHAGALSGSVVEFKDHHSHSPVGESGSRLEVRFGRQE